MRVTIETGPNKGFNFKTHPNIDKQLYSSENLLGLKDPERPFPIGSPVGILKWRMQARPTLAHLNSISAACMLRIWLVWRAVHCRWPTLEFLARILSLSLRF